MNFAKFIENLLLRDVLSYVMPGSLIILIFIAYGLDNGTILPILKNASDIGGELAALLGFAGVAYVIGYLASTALFYLRDRIRWFKKPDIQPIRPEIMTKLKQTFGYWVETTSPRYLTAICLHYVEIRKPEYYYEKIERRTSLRNFEVGIAAVLVMLGIAQLIALQGYFKLFAVLPLLGAYAMMRSSRNLDAAIDRMTFITFYTAVMADIYKGEDSLKRRV